MRTSQVGPDAQAAPPPPPGPRRLVRPRDDKRIGGVCGGIARYTNVDATLVRVLSVVAAVFLFPLPVLAYVLLWAIIPAQ